MKVRSITLFAPTLPRQRAALAPLAALGARVREALERADFAVQTVRLATPPWPRHLSEAAELLDTARWLESELSNHGLEYLSLGPVDPFEPGWEEQAALCTALLAATERTFCTLHIAGAAQGVHVAAARAAATIIAQSATLETHGFANLRFAALANVPAGSPFFPAAYSAPDATRPAVALALESADLAVAAFRHAPSLEQGRQRLVAVLEEVAQRLVAAVQPAIEALGADFGGLDFSLAPFPDAATSGAGAIESLGAAPFGAMGTLAAAAATTQALQEARYPRCGFSGLMLPLLEDSVLAARSLMGSYDLHSLLLFSAVCGTGLDTVPLPGDIRPETLTAILLDVAALAVRLDKPLTARLMPIPGGRAGEKTRFDFAFFANGAILEPRAPLGGALLGEELLRLRAR